MAEIHDPNPVAGLNAIGFVVDRNIGVIAGNTGKKQAAPNPIPEGIKTAIACTTVQNKKKI